MRSGSRLVRGGARFLGRGGRRNVGRPGDENGVDESHYLRVMKVDLADAWLPRRSLHGKKVDVWTEERRFVRSQSGQGTRTSERQASAQDGGGFEEREGGQLTSSDNSGNAVVLVPQKVKAKPGREY